MMGVAGSDSSGMAYRSPHGKCSNKAEIPPLVPAFYVY